MYRTTSSAQTWQETRQGHQIQPSKWWFGWITTALNPIFSKIDGLCTFLLSTLLDSLVWMTFKSDSLNQTQNESVYSPALHVSYGWLAYVLFHAYHLDACGQKSLGSHAYLSGWHLKYGLSDMIFALYCLSAWELYLKNPLWSSSLICQSPTKAIWWYFLKTIYTYAACFCIELCQIVVTLERILFMLSWSRFTCTPYTPLLCFFEKLALYHPLIPQNKCSTICVGLSL